MRFSVFADSTDTASFGHRARQKRMNMLLERFPDFRSMRIIDLGGDARYWRASNVRPAHVTIVALHDWELRSLAPWMSGVFGDACDPATFTDTYDLAFSNSVIEHVGGPRYRRAFADNIRKLAPHYWVQTPYRYFPLEPHFKFPCFQFLPLAIQVQVAQHWSGSYLPPHSEPVEYIVDHELLSITEMRALFPGCELVRERVAGLVKSITATC
jgi:hypothetical protein